MCLRGGCTTRGVPERLVQSGGLLNFGLRFDARYCSIRGPSCELSHISGIFSVHLRSYGLCVTAAFGTSLQPVRTGVWDPVPSRLRVSRACAFACFRLRSARADAVIEAADGVEALVTPSCPCACSNVNKQGERAPRGNQTKARWSDVSDQSQNSQPPLSNLRLCRL